ncbi:MAG: IS1634 family transposase [Thermoanaerobaculaceae bacterium]|jgi:transposase|nr:IS1634 family transposase [Thermoanaerobaculaceae bacterium]
MHLVTKVVKGHEYFYLVEKARQGNRVFTAQTVYIGDRRRLAEMIQLSASTVIPTSFAPQSVGAALALVRVATDLGLEPLIDEICPVREGAAPVGRRLLLAALHRVLAPRHENGLRPLGRFYEESVLSELLPIAATTLDDRRMGELLGSLTARQVERIEAAVVKRLVEQEAVDTQALAFDCTNFDSFAGARNRSRLLRRGHAKSGRPLRVLGMGLLATVDEGLPLLTFTYPGNENDVTAFRRFLRALDRRRAAFELPLEATVAADGGNVSKQLLLRLEKTPRYYVMRLPPHHLGDLPRLPQPELPPLSGSLKGKVWGTKQGCLVYGTKRWVVDVYSRRMHQRQLPGLRRDRDRARADLVELQRLLQRQEQGLRQAKPLTLKAVRRRVDKALSREHMAALFQVQLSKGERAPILAFTEPEAAWTHLQQYVLGRTLLVTNRGDWPPEQIVRASRMQSYNERAFRELKDPAGASMLPLRHRRDPALRAHALVVVLALLLAKLVQRRVKRAGTEARSLASVLGPLKAVQRARVQYGDDAPPALRALAKGAWIPSAKSPRQQELLRALGLAERRELGTTLAERLSPKTARNRPIKPSQDS